MVPEAGMASTVVTSRIGGSGKSHAIVQVCIAVQTALFDGVLQAENVELLSASLLGGAGPLQGTGIGVAVAGSGGGMMPSPSAAASCWSGGFECIQ